MLIQRQEKLAIEFLSQQMGLVANRAVKEKIPMNLSPEEIKTYKKRFEILDKDKKGFVSITDIRRGLKVLFICNINIIMFC